jgi:hypothetical protein
MSHDTDPVDQDLHRFPVSPKLILSTRGRFIIPPALSPRNGGEDGRTVARGTAASPPFTREIEDRIVYEHGMVEVAGRYERSGPWGEGEPSVAVAVMVKPRQPVFLVPILVYGTIPVLAVVVFLPLYLVGRDVRR